MKKIILSSLLVLIAAMSCQSPQKEIVVEKIVEKEIINMDPLLRHVVLFKFKDESSEEEIQKVVDAFMALKSKISEIEDVEWGTNNSPEGLDQGFTHCFLVSFKTEEDRDTYLPHPEHRAFVEVLGPHLDKVLVVDYWAKKD
jgi:hypothetical protein